MTECDVSLCKSNALELGRLLAELQTKTIRSGLQGVREKELKELERSIKNLINPCKIQDKDIKDIKKAYGEVWNSQVLAGGTEMSHSLIRLKDKLFHSVSKCDE